MSRTQALLCVLGVSLCAFAVLLNHRLELLGAASSGSTEVQLIVLGYDDDVDPPYVEDMVPSSGATLVGISSGVLLHVKDFKNNNGVTAGSGVDLSTVQVTISYGVTSQTYVDGDPEFTASGIVVNRIITVQPATSFPYSTRVTVSVRASDLHVPPNAMSVFRYSFLTEPDPTPPASSSSASGGGTVPFPGGPDDPNGGHRHEGSPPGPGATSPLPDRIFPDVPVGIWYDGALRHFVRTGIFDRTQPLFRPADGTLRAEMATVLVRLAGIKNPRTPVASSFSDVFRGKWYYSYVEEAAAQGWMIGYGDCFGLRHPCEDRPEIRVTRAEAAKMIVRAYGLQPLGLAPGFPDMPPYAWYNAPISTAADHCIIQGDGANAFAYPESSIKRSELVMMLYRAEAQMVYGRDCTRGTSSPFAGELGAGAAAAITLAETAAVLAGAAGVWAVTRENGSGKPQKVTRVSYSPRPSALRSRRGSKPKRRA